MQLTAIVGATVIDGTGGSPVDDAVVLIEDERIRSVTRAAETPVPEQATVIDARGRYIIPGVMDANVHYVMPPPDIALQYEDRYEDLALEAAQIALRSGVTTVFDTWGPVEPLVATRDRIDRGEVAGSRMFVAGNIVGQGGLFSEDMFSAGNVLGPDIVDRINRRWEQGVGPDLLWLTPEEVGERVAAYIERTGVDFVKYLSSSHLQYQFIAFSAEAQRAIVEAGHRAGLTVQAHSTSVESLRMEIEAGADLLQHGDITGQRSIPDTTLKTIVERALPVAALVCTERFMSWVEECGSQLMRAGHNRIQDENDRRLIEAGARLLLTTDAFVCTPRVMRHPARTLWRDAPDCPIILGEAHFLWLEAVAERGMAPMDILLSATRNVAEAYGQDRDLGTLEPGKRADLLIIEADPLADVRNYRRIAEVMKDGALVDRDALPASPVLTEPADDEHTPAMTVQK